SNKGVLDHEEYSARPRPRRFPRYPSTRDCREPFEWESRRESGRRQGQEGPQGKEGRQRKEEGRRRGEEGRRISFPRSVKPTRRSPSIFDESGSPMRPKPTPRH